MIADLRIPTSALQLVDFALGVVLRLNRKYETLCFEKLIRIDHPATLGTNS
jgi:hypothetical protein